MKKRTTAVQSNLGMEAIRAQMKKTAAADDVINRRGQLFQLNTLIGDKFSPTEVGRLLNRLTFKMETSDQRAADLAYELQKKGISFQ